MTNARVIWSDAANDDVRSILSLVAEFSGWSSSEKYLDEFEKIVNLAGMQPYMGKPGLITGTRELYPINGKYRIVYRLLNENTENFTLEVVSVLMTRRQYP